MKKINKSQILLLDNLLKNQKNRKKTIKQNYWSNWQGC